jgi:hypothetical protein
VMEFWPYKKLNLHISAPKEVVIDKLRLNTEPIKEVPSVFKHINSNKYFYGNITENNFTIVPVVWYRSSFIPIIKGQMVNQGNETVVNMRIQIYEITTAFMIIWLTCCISFFLRLVISLLGKQFQFGILAVPIIMFFFGYVLMLFSFKHDVKKSIKRLARIFDLPVN